MKNYRITIQYDGTRYHGWQRQGNTGNTIQEKFEAVLSKMCGCSVEIFASGRTDAGVHAKEQTANFKCETDMTPDEIMTYLNHYLPEDIAVLSIKEADMRFHSRLSAVSKTYVYQMATQKPDVFMRKYVFHSQERPDLSVMQEAAKKLLGTHDFKGFSSVGRTKKSTVRTLYDIQISEQNGLISFQIKGSGFLYHMVRILVGTLYEIGIGKKDARVIDEILQEKNRELAGPTLPAKGLQLARVAYHESC